MDEFTGNVAEFGSKLFVLCVFAGLAIVACSLIFLVLWGLVAAGKTLARIVRR